MSEIERDAIGKRLREVRKQRGLNQTELANMLGKSLRTIQKYESGEIEISIAMINELARKLDTTATYLLGNKSADVHLDCLADIMGFLFQMDQAKEFHFTVDVKRPPHDENWQCSLVFDGKDKTADLNADICLFLEEWQEYREDLQAGRISPEKYEQWKDKTLAYYSSVGIRSASSDSSEGSSKSE